MNVIAPYQELYDARKVPLGWDRPHFDDGDWPQATVLLRPHATWPRTQMVPRDIPDMTAEETPPVAVQAVEECLDIDARTRWGDLTIGLSQAGVPLRHARVEGAERLCTGGEATVQCSTDHLDHVFDGIYDPCIVLDFGRVITAYPRLELDGVDGGCVDIGYAERLIDGRFNNAIEGQFADRYVMVARLAELPALRLEGVPLPEAALPLLLPAGDGEVRPGRRDHLPLRGARRVPLLGRAAQPRLRALPPHHPALLERVPDGHALAGAGAVAGGRLGGDAARHLRLLRGRRAAGQVPAPDGGHAARRAACWPTSRTCPARRRAALCPTTRSGGLSASGTTTSTAATRAGCRTSTRWPSASSARTCGTSTGAACWRTCPAGPSSTGRTSTSAASARPTTPSSTARWRRSAGWRS